MRDIECRKHDSFFLFYIHWSISYIRPASFEVGMYLIVLAKTKVLFFFHVKDVELRLRNIIWL